MTIEGTGYTIQPMLSAGIKCLLLLPTTPFKVKPIQLAPPYMVTIKGDPLVAGWPIKSTDHGRGRCFVSFCPWPINAKPDTLRYPQLGGISGLITLEEVDRLPQWCRKVFAFEKMVLLVMGC